ncbi:NADP-dependent oxidoreductase [Staphylococcus haemolyticus]|uniref:NADP-dependent oxidoreductase n=1 Tax=Staphylococcus haemolyticus TaxID=1283 RepID=UPI00265C35D9|nr:NADP-dependent oxidoreductase [Staphylococcus haemolyticus]MDO0967663.1 NADP-dependent oxidoreductase [Staphylococcus haemolyticus]
MKAAKLKEYGGSDQIDIVEVNEPILREDEVIVSVVASSINPVDVKTMTPGTIQQIQRFPVTLGWDIAGIVTETSSKSTLKIGDRVIGMNPPNSMGEGSWQQKVVISQQKLVKLPEDIDLYTAASLPLGALTAYQALSRLTFTSDSKLLVTGALGSVGGYAIQLAKLQGIDVSGLVREKSQKETVLKLGASTVYSNLDSLPEFDTVFDTAGIVHHPEILKENGQLITVSDEEISEAVNAHASLADHNYVRQNSKVLQHLVDLVAQDKLTLRIAENYNFHNLREALEFFNQGGHNGKIIISF